MSDQQDALRDALRRSAAALTDADTPFALGGSYALWVNGAPEPAHDVDLVVAEQDVDRAATVLAAAGFAVDRPPEGWLIKAALGGATVDVLHRLHGEPVDPDTLAGAERRQVLAVWMPVLTATHVITVKLLTMDEHYCDFGALLPVVRAVREQLDWPAIAKDTADNDFAVAFLVLAQRLGIAPPGTAPLDG